MNARLRELLGIEKYKQLIDKIPKHIKEEYVVHRFLSTESKAMNIDEIEQEIEFINKKYRAKEGLKPISQDYLRNEWNMKNELKKRNIQY